MPDYKYRAILRDGKVIRGKIIAVNKHQVITKLKDAKIQPIIIRKMKTSKIDSRMFIRKNINPKTKYTPQHLAHTADFKKISFKNFRTIDFHPFSKIKTKDIISFVNNLYILKKANFNNIQALQSLYDGIDNPAFKDLVEDLLIGVESGERLNSVMSNYPRVFPAMFINFVKVGEESGTLDTALLYARDYIESSTKLKKQIRGAIIPRVLQFVGIMLSMFFAVILGVPMLKTVYDTFGSTATVPEATLAALSIAEWFISNWFIVLMIIIGIIFVFITYINTPRGRYNWDKLLMTFPVVGNLNTNITISKFFQAMLLNLKNGMRIQESLDVSKEVTNNYYFLSLIEVAKSNSLIGESWIVPFEESRVFKPMVSEMISIGMKTNLAEMMEKVNQYINMEIDESISKFVKWLPDISYLFVGIALIGFMIVVMIPLIQVYMGSFITA
ncbi:MAG: type II secretion system F family protein [Clostridia bacterium]|nr:type II secretion system F family protein [Clostridia bacterium]MDD4386269.1 type II secretion system F family protein [Clostridia bacterium]